MSTIYRCKECGRPIKEGKERFFNNFAYGKCCYFKVINNAVEYETMILRKKGKNGKSSR